MLGLVIADLTLGVSVMTPTLAGLPGFNKILPKFTAVVATAGELSFVGFDALTASLQDIEIAVNTGTPWVKLFPALGSPVVDYAASFANDEVIEFFDFDNSDGITVSDLTELGVDEVPGLYDALSDPAQPITSAELIAALGGEDGQLQLGEVSAFGDGADNITATGADADGDGKLDPAGYEVRTGTTTAPVYITHQGNKFVRAEVGNATLQISDFVHISGSIRFEQGIREDVNLEGGLFGGTIDDIAAFLTENGFPDDTGLPLLDPVVELQFLTVSASDVHAFIGIDFGDLDGTYWHDADGNGRIEGGEFDLPPDPDAFGLLVEDFDFGLAIMTPTALLNPSRYFALNSTAEQISLVGLDGVTLNANSISVEVNQSTPSIFGVSLFPVVNFETTFASERPVLFDLLAGGDGIIDVADLDDAFGAGHGISDPFSSIAQMMDFLDVTGALPSPGPDGVLDVAEVVGRLTETFKDAANGADTNLDLILAADADGDGKFDPAGFEINTGGKPIYLDMNSSLVKAEGSLELDILGVLTMAGSVAFELGPQVELTLGNSNTVTATTMTIGAADVSAFLGVKDRDRYWIDSNNNNEVDVGELDPKAVGLAITDLDIGLALFASTRVTVPEDLGVYLAGSADVPEEGIAFVGLPDVTVSGSFAIDINVGIGGSGLSAVDFRTSFPGEIGELETNGTPGIQLDEVPTLDPAGSAENSLLFDAIDTSGEGTITYEELLAHYDGADNGLAADGLLQTINLPTALKLADIDGDGLFDAPGFQVNTGNPLSPVFLDFESGLINLELVGKINILDIAELKGGFLFNISEVTTAAGDTTQLSVLAVAELSLGPDIGEDDKFFGIQVIGALVINGDGIAADMRSTLELGADLGIVDLGALEVQSRIILNTTGLEQRIAIPERFEAVLDTTPSPDNPIQDDGAGNLFYVIQPNAPPKADGTIFADGAYFVVIFSAQFNILSTIFFNGDFRLTATASQLSLSTNADLSFMFDGTEAFKMEGSFDLLFSLTEFRVSADASLSLGLLGSLAANGDMLIDADGIRARIDRKSVV